ncbi:MAG: hypothetical protein PHI97_06130 [Desulfobulbus sp.]|nr:hypothetical protein [Desulfobulbus sp.]
MQTPTAPSSLYSAECRENGTAVQGKRQKERPFILAVTRNGHMSEHVMDYALNVAHRLQYNILAVHVDTLPFFSDRGKRSKLFASGMQESEQIFQGKAQSQGVIVEHVAELGKISSVIDRLCHAKKRIEFVVIDKGIRLASVAKGSPVPVFPVITTKAGQSSKTIFHITKGKGVFAMSTISKAHHVKNCIVFGALTAGLYAAVFTHSDVVMKYWTKGGVYALLPVATVFAVSYLHGNFTSSFWSMLGIEASKTAGKKAVETDRKVVAPRPDTRPRAQVNA